MPKRILYLSQWFDPELIQKSGLDFVAALRSRGLDVEVLTGFPNYPTGRIMPGYRLGLYRYEVMRGVPVNRVFLYPSHSRSSFGRMLNFLSFFLSSLIFCLLRARRYDAIYVYHPPITSAVAAALAGMLWRRPFILEVQDLWPESVAASGMTGTGTMARLLGPVCRFVYRRAAMVIGPSTSITALLVERGADPVRSMTCFNWADEDAARSSGTYDMRPLGFEGRFNIVYGGNLGAVQGLDVLVKAAHQAAREVPEILLTLIGEGIEKESLQTLIREIGTTAVQIRPSVPRSQIGDVFTAADVLALHLTDQPLFSVTVPSKLQFYLATGKPVLAAVKGEARQIVDDAGAGVTTAPDDVDAIAAAMIRMARLPRNTLAEMGENARSAYRERFSFDQTLDRIHAAIARVLDDPS